MPSIWSTLLGGPESQTRAYIYAFPAFTCVLLKAQADVQHLWYPRRASTRIRSEHGSTIWQGAEEEGFSGVVNKEKEKG